MLTTLLRGLLPIGLLLCGMIIAGGLARGLWRYTINRYLLAAMVLVASPALAELAPYQGSDGRIFPGLAPHWGAYTLREPTPRLGVDNGQANPEYRMAERGDWDNNTAPGSSWGSPGDYHGNNVAISTPGGRMNINEAIQSAIQAFGRMMSGGGGNANGTVGGCSCAGGGNYNSGGTGTSYK